MLFPSLPDPLPLVEDSLSDSSMSSSSSMPSKSLHNFPLEDLKWSHRCRNFPPKSHSGGSPAGDNSRGGSSSRLSPGRRTDKSEKKLKVSDSASSPAANSEIKPKTKICIRLKTKPVKPAEEPALPIKLAGKPIKLIKPAEEHSKQVKPAGKPIIKLIKPAEGNSTKQINPAVEPTKLIKPAEDYPSKLIKPAEVPTKVIKPGEDSTMLIKLVDESSNVVIEHQDEHQPMELDEVKESIAKAWRLRPRRRLVKGPRPNVDVQKLSVAAPGETKAQEPSLPESSEPQATNEAVVTERKGKEIQKERPNKPKKSKFSISLTKLEIEEDFYAMTGSKPPRKPMRRPKHVQKELDCLFPGMWLCSITPDMYKVHETPKWKK